MSGSPLESITVLNLARELSENWQWSPAQGADESLHLTPISPHYTIRKLTKNVTS